jgi:hypothetical protein
MKEERETLDQFIDKIRLQLNEYVELRVEYFKAQLTEKLALVLSEVISLFVLGAILLFILLFISIVAGFYFSSVIGSYYKGFGIVAIVYIIIGLFTLVFKKQLFYNKISKRIISIVYNGDEK